MNLKITTRDENPSIVVDVDGRVTLENAPEFLEALMSLLKKRKPPRVVVNMSHASYIDSAGVACLVEALQVARDSKIAFVLFGLGAVARDVFGLTRLISVFEIYNSEEEALRGNRSAPASAVD